MTTNNVFIKRSQGLNGYEYYDFVPEVEQNWSLSILLYDLNKLVQVSEEELIDYINEGTEGVIIVYEDEEPVNYRFY